MKKLIVFASKYGTSKRYAQELSKRTGIEAKDYTEIDDEKADELIFVGGLYAGEIIGLKNTVNKIQPEKLIAVSVGLVDPNIEENKNNLHDMISKSIPEKYKDSAIFNLRGGMQLEKLNFKHRLIMKFLNNRLKKVPLNERSPQVRDMIECYGKSTDFVDFETLTPIIEEINK